MQLDHSFKDHFQQKTKGSDMGQFVTWVDQWCWNNGYRITFSGGIIPERFWTKDGFERIVVRQDEVNDSMKFPATEEQLKNWIFNKVLW